MSQKWGASNCQWNIIDFLAAGYHRNIQLEIQNLPEQPFITLPVATDLPEISLSIIIPYVKDKTTPGRVAIESLLKQNYPDFEIILVSSGFGYEVPGELADLIAHDKIKFFYYPTFLPESRLINKGRKEARGKEVLVITTNQVYRQDFLIQEQKNKNTIPRRATGQNRLPIKIAYLVSNLELSGGTAVILQHTQRLLTLGYDVFLLCLECQSAHTWKSLSVPVYPYHTKFTYTVNPMDIAIGTHWPTAYFLPPLPAQRKIYFVQSDERRFYPTERDVKLINSTYGMNFEFMTEALWIQRWLQEEFQHEAYYVPNGLDGELFHPAEPIVPKTRPRILLEGAIGYWYKGMAEAYAAVTNLEADLWIVSSHGTPKRNWQYQAFFQRVPIDEMKRIYSSCDILLKMSLVEGFFGPPLEAMACGCAVVVSKVTGYDEYIKDGYNALVVDKGDIGGARAAVRKLLTDESLRLQLVQNGLKTAAEWNWHRTLQHLEDVIQKRPVKKYYSASFPEPYDYKKEMQTIKNRYQNYLHSRTTEEKFLEILSGLKSILRQLVRGMTESESISEFMRFLLGLLKEKLSFFKS